MINITYKYEIKKVDDISKIMEVEYSSLGYNNITVSMPLPYTDISVEDHIRTYAPLHHWEMSKKTYQDVSAGVVGIIEHRPNNNSHDSGTTSMSEEEVLKLISELRIGSR